MPRTCLPYLVFALALAAPAASWSASAADPTGTAPIGIEEKPDAKGPKLTGVLHIELVNSDGVSADRARMTARLRRGSLVHTFFVVLEGPLSFDDEDPEEVVAFQADVLEAFRPAVLGAFFADSCGASGLLCPSVGLVLKNAEEFGLDSDVDNQFVMLDVVISTTRPL